MRTLTSSALLLLGVTLAGAAQAELIQADWQTVGDQRAVMDTSSQLLWLDVSETVGQSINQVAAQLETTYAGWRLASDVEVESLFARTFNGYLVYKDYTGTKLDRGTPDADKALVELFGRTHGSVDWPASDGLYVQNGNVMRAGANVATNMFYEDELRATDLDYQASFAGVYLVANVGDIVVGGSGGDPADVPAPWGFGAITLGLLALGRRRQG